MTEVSLTALKAKSGEHRRDSELGVHLASSTKEIRRRDEIKVVGSDVWPFRQSIVARVCRCVPISI